MHTRNTQQLPSNNIRCVFRVRCLYLCRPVLCPIPDFRGYPFVSWGTHGETSNRDSITQIRMSQDTIIQTLDRMKTLQSAGGSDNRYSSNFIVTLPIWIGRKGLYFSGSISFGPINSSFTPMQVEVRDLQLK